MLALETVDNLRWEPLPDKSLDNLTLSSLVLRPFFGRIRGSEPQTTLDQGDVSPGRPRQLIQRRCCMSNESPVRVTQLSLAGG